MRFGFVLRTSIKLVVVVVTLSLFALGVYGMWMWDDLPRKGVWQVHAEPLQLPEATFFTDLKGRDVTYASLWPQERLWLVNVWASWCGPCQKEMPILNDIQKVWSPRGLAVLMVNRDHHPQGVDGVRLWLKHYMTERGLENMRHVVYRADTMADFHLPGIPVTLLVDARGRELARFAGALPEQDATLKALLEQHLAPHQKSGAP